MLGISYNIPNITKEKDMENNKTFYIVYYSNKDKKHITRRGKHDEKSRYGTSKKGVPCFGGPEPSIRSALPGHVRQAGMDSRCRARFGLVP